MNPSSQHLVPGSMARRFAAALLNLVFAGLVIVSASALVDGAVSPRNLSLAACAFAICGLTLLWLLSLFRRMSLGSMFCLLEIRSYQGARPTLGQFIVRSAPIFAIPITGIFPAGILPLSVEIVRMALLLLLLMAAAASAAVALFTGHSVFDRLSKTVVFQLRLSKEAMPRVFGFRIM